MEIVIFLALLAGYCALMYFLVVYIGPPIVVLAALVFVGLVPVAYARSLFRVFAQDSTDILDSRGWRNLALVPVMAILALCYLDFAALTMTFASVTRFTQFVPSVAAGPLFALESQIIWPAVMHALVNRYTVSWASALLPLGSPAWLIVLLSSAIKIAFIPPFLLLARGFESQTEGEQQPARLAYFHAEAIPDLGMAIRLCVEFLYGVIRRIAVKVYGATTSGAQGCLIWPVAISLGVGLAAPAVIGLIALAVLIVMHSLAVALMWLLAMFLSAFLFCAERAVILARAGYAKCPHARCHAKVPLPVFECPECGEKHDHLVPGKFGLFVRHCSCGKGVLPTLFWWGKSRLTALCPECGKTMEHQLFGGSVHLPIVGAPSVGKTMFLTANAWMLAEGKVPGVESSMIGQREQERYELRAKPAFEAGREPKKTRGPQQDAFLMSVRRGVGLPISLYMYDPAGEAFEDAGELRQHRFYRYFDGMALLVDPLSLRTYVERLPAGGAAVTAAKGSLADPTAILDRVKSVLEEQSNLQRHRKFGRRIAVVLTKADLPGLAGEIGISLDRRPLESKWANLGRDESAKVAGWLARNAPELHQALQTQFDDIRYFAVSSTGRDQSPGRAFRPAGVVEPLAWLLSRRQTLARPLVGRILGRTAELAAIAAVVVLFFGIPTYAIERWVVPVLTERVEVIELEP